MHVCVIFGADEGIVVGNWSYLPMPKVIYKTIRYEVIIKKKLTVT